MSGRRLNGTELAIPNKICVIKNCTNTNLNKDITLFRFPRGAKTFRKWLQNARIEAEKAKAPTAAVCINHFEKQCINKKRLRTKSVPTRALGYADPPLHRYNKHRPVGYKKICLIENCQPDQNGMFFKVPLWPEELRAQWIKACNITVFKSQSRMLICQKHFEPESMMKCCLVKNTVPTLNLPQDENNDIFEIFEYAKETETTQLLQQQQQHQQTFDNEFETFDDIDMKIEVTNSPIYDETSTDNADMTKLCTDKERFYQNRIAQLEELLTSEITAKTQMELHLQQQLQNIIPISSEATTSAIDFAKMIVGNSNNRLTKAQEQIATDLYNWSPLTYKRLRTEMGFHLPSSEQLLSNQQNNNHDGEITFVFTLSDDSNNV